MRDWSSLFYNNLNFTISSSDLEGDDAVYFVRSTGENFEQVSNLFNQFVKDNQAELKTAIEYDLEKNIFPVNVFLEFSGGTHRFPHQKDNPIMLNRMSDEYEIDRFEIQTDKKNKTYHLSPMIKNYISKINHRSYRYSRDTQIALEEYLLSKGWFYIGVNQRNNFGKTCKTMTSLNNSINELNTFFRDYLKNLKHLKSWDEESD